MWVQCMHSAHKFLQQQHKIIFISSKHQQMLFFLGHQESEAGSNFSNVHCLRIICLQIVHKFGHLITQDQFLTCVILIQYSLLGCPKKTLFLSIILAVESLVRMGDLSHQKKIQNYRPINDP